MAEFRKATKHAGKLRLALVGPAGSGKTFTGLTMASALGGRVAVVDTERGSASKYADLFSFDVLELETFAPQRYVEAIAAAAQAGYDVLLIDSLSHAWTGKGGALEMHDDATARAKGGNSFTAWREVTPHHNAMIDAILRAPMHVIVTMRTKTEYVVEDGGKKVRKVGLAPVQRDGLEYEFDVVGDLDQDNTLVVGKTRCPALSGQVIRKPGKDFADLLSAWLAGSPVQAPQSKPSPAKTNGGTKATPDGVRHRIAAAEKRLAEEGLCRSGDLTQFLLRECVRFGLRGDLTFWATDNLKVVGDLVKDFEANCRSDREPIGDDGARELEEILLKNGATAADALKLLDHDKKTRLSDLTRAERRIVEASVTQEAPAGV